MWKPPNENEREKENEPTMTSTAKNSEKVENE
jgi:hypothetical protein